VESVISALNGPRYEPCPIAGTTLAVWRDRQEKKYVTLCSECHRLITYETLDALYIGMMGDGQGRCQGCQARRSFERNPALIGTVLDFWYRTGAFPQSPSWVEAISPYQCNVRAKEIRAGLVAATAPIMYVSSWSVTETDRVPA
jgi:hypothetical protein